MPSKTLFAVAVLLGTLPAPSLAKPFFVDPDEEPDPRGLTISGSGLARVEPPRHLGEDSIEPGAFAAASLRSPPRRSE
jgi:hypothetical protein